MKAKLTSTPLQGAIAISQLGASAALEAEEAARIAGDAAEATARLAGIAAEAALRTAADALKANIASPALTGVPTAPTAGVNSNTTQLSTTAFVQAQIADLMATSPAVYALLVQIAAILADDQDLATALATELADHETRITLNEYLTGEAARRVCDRAGTDIDHWLDLFGAIAMQLDLGGVLRGIAASFAVIQPTSGLVLPDRTIASAVPFDPDLLSAELDLFGAVISRRYPTGELFGRDAAHIVQSVPGTISRIIGKGQSNGTRKGPSLSTPGLTAKIFTGTDFSGAIDNASTNPTTAASGIADKGVDGSGEISAAAAAYYIERQTNSGFGAGKSKLLVHVTNEAGRAISGEARDTVFWNRFQQRIAEGQSLCNTAGEVFGEAGIVYETGEKDTGLETDPDTFMRSLARDIRDTSIAAGLPKGRILPASMSQLASWCKMAVSVTPLVSAVGDIGQQQMFAFARLNIAFACPDYQFPFLTDQLHMTNHGTRWRGFHHGRALWHFLDSERTLGFGRGEVWRGCRPVKVYRYASGSRTIVVEIDTMLDEIGVHAGTFNGAQLIADATDNMYGFELYDGANKVSIARVNIDARAKKAFLTATADIADPYAAYAWTPENQGTATINAGVDGALFADIQAGPTIGTRGQIAGALTGGVPQYGPSEITDDVGAPYEMWDRLAAFKLPVGYTELNWRS